MKEGVKKSISLILVLTLLVQLLPVVAFGVGDETNDLDISTDSETVSMKDDDAEIVGEEDALRLQYALAERQPNAAFYAVRGNCDVFSRLPETLEVRFGRTKALVTHGHLFRVKLTCSLLAEAARRRECRLALFGHTHRPACETEGGVCLVNPGALAQGKWALVRVGEDGDIHAALRAL